MIRTIKPLSYSRILAATVRYNSQSSQATYLERDEEPDISLEKSIVSNDNQVFTIVHRTNSIKEAVQFYQAERQELSLFHKSILLNRSCSLAKKQFESNEPVDPGLRHVQEQMVAEIAAELFEQIHELDYNSVSHLLKVFAFSDRRVKINYRPTPVNMQNLQDKILKEFSQYLQHDVSIALASILRLGHYPDILLKELDQMNKLSTLSHLACIRLLEALVNYQRQCEDPHPHTTSSVIHKLHDALALQQS